MRKPREHGWRTSDGITHHIDTRQANAYHTSVRVGTCGVGLHTAKRVRFDSVDCMTCIVRVSKRARSEPRPIPTQGPRSWWTADENRHVLSTIDPWRAVCGASLRAAYRSSNTPNCVPCGGKPGGAAMTHSLRDFNGVRHAIQLDDSKPKRYAPCGADILEATVTRKAPNCLNCLNCRNALRQKGKPRGRQIPRTQRR